MTGVQTCALPISLAGPRPASDLRRDGSFEYYMSEPIVEDDAKGVGPLLLAYTELRRLES